MKRNRRISHAAIRQTRATSLGWGISSENSTSVKRLLTACLAVESTAKYRGDRKIHRCWMLSCNRLLLSRLRMPRPTRLARVCSWIVAGDSSESVSIQSLTSRVSPSCAILSSVWSSDGLPVGARLMTVTGPRRASVSIRSANANSIRTDPVRASSRVLFPTGRKTPSLSSSRSSRTSSGKISISRATNSRLIVRRSCAVSWDCVLFSCHAAPLFAGATVGGLTPPISTAAPRPEKISAFRVFRGSGHQPPARNVQRLAGGMR